MSTPLLSIIMPVFNVDRYLEAAILSVLNGEFDDFELIIINDASSDQSLAVAQLFETIDDRIQVIDLRYNTIGGAGVPSNVGIERARGEYVAFVDSDDFLSAQSLTLMMQQIRLHKSDVCIGNFRTFRDDTKNISAPYDATIWADLPKNEPINPRKYRSVFRLSPVPWRKIYKRSFLQNNFIRFPEVDSFFEDNPLHWDVLTAAQSVVLVDTFISYHRMARPGQTMSANSPQLSAFFQHLTSIVQAIHKNGADFAWGELLHFIFETRWIVARQKDPRIAKQFQKRFFQFMHDHVLPNLSEEHQAGAKKILDRYKSDYKRCDISFVLFAKRYDDALDATMRSIEAIKNLRIEVILLLEEEAAKKGQEWPNVIKIPPRNNAARSYNLAMPLCSGDFICYLRSGDQVNARALEAALRDPSINSAEIIGSVETAKFLDWSPPRSIYQRRFIQDNAVYFGPSENGEFSFNIVTESLSEKKALVESSFIEHDIDPQKPIRLDTVMTEASNLLQRIRHRSLQVDERKSVVDKISYYITDAENYTTLDTIKELELSRGYLTSQISLFFSGDRGAE